MSEEGGIFWGISFWVVFLGALFLMNAGVVTYEVVKYPDYATAATTSAVTVTAKVAQDISCGTDSGSTAFGTLTSTATTTSSPNATTTMSCGNVAGGCTLNIRDLNAGLATDSPAYTITSPAAGAPASATLAAGTEGYGVRIATTTDTGESGAELTIGSRYNLTGNDIGGLTTTNIGVASTTATTTNRAIDTTHEAAVSGSTQAADYTDTITYECTAT